MIKARRPNRFSRIPGFGGAYDGPPASLDLPHGDPVPQKPEGPIEAGVDGQRQQGTFGAVGYVAARLAEQEGRAPSRAGAVVHERIDRLKLQYQSREFIRNNALYQGMLKRARAYIVGRGFALTCRTSDPEWNRDTEQKYRSWWRLPEVTGTFSGRRVEAMVCEELLTCGELGVILTDERKPPREGLPERDQLQLVEAEQIMGREWINQGIDRDEMKRPIQYWVSPYQPNTGYPLYGSSVAYKPGQFLHVASFDRPSSGRAVPPCQSAFPMLHRINSVCDSEAIAWQMQARVCLVSNRASGLPMPGAVGAQKPGAPATAGDVTHAYQTVLRDALIFHGKPGDTISGMERTSPGSSFSESLTMFFRLLGLPLGLPLELILLDWTHSNYSQSRAVLEQAFTMFLDWQDLLVDLFHDRVFEWWLLRSIARGEIKDREDKLSHDWIRPTFPWIDQLAEAEGMGEKVDRGFASWGSVCKSLGQDQEDLREDLTLETIEAIQAAQTVEDATGVSVPWEPFAGKKPPSKPAEIEAETDAKPGEQGGSGDEDSTDKPDPKKKALKTPEAVAANTAERVKVRAALVEKFRARRVERERAKCA